ncbi:hypothetical protein GQ44DRAFT_717233 [Phaeosphaeriaceae sp. PMI808]|nr:hypothetical protein GQ44DRAFT_717233 [Phaeosphaeriaceae sp. PMI808]
MAEDGNSSAEDENSSVDGEDIPENGGPWDGHIYQDVVATKEAKQANGDIGDRKKLSPRRSQFSSVKAKDKSKQVNGNMTLEAFEAFMK